MYKMNRIGPNREPWGTPNNRHRKSDNESSTLTLKNLPERYELNHFNAESLIDPGH